MQGPKTLFQVKAPLALETPKTACSVSQEVKTINPVHPRSASHQHNQRNKKALSTDVLLPPVLQAQEGWVPPAHHRPFSTKSTSGRSKISYANSSIHQDVSVQTSVGMHSRRHKSVQPRSNKSSVSQILRIRNRERSQHEGVRVPVHALRPVIGPMGFYQSHAPHQVIREGKTHFAPLILGRFCNIRGFSKRGNIGSQCSEVHSPEIGLQHQCKKVKLYPKANHNLSRGSIQSTRSHPLSSKGKNPQDNVSIFRVYEKRDLLQKRLGATNRATEFRSVLRAVRASTPSPPHSMDEQVHGSIVEGQGRTVRPKPPVGPANLVKPVNVQVTSPHAHSTAHRGTHDGRVPDRLVRGLPPIQNTRVLAQVVDVSPHQLAGTESSSSLTHSLRRPGKRQGRAPVVRQHDSPMVHKKSGHPKVGPSHELNSRNPRFVHRVAGHSSSPTLAWSPKCSGRRRVQRLPGPIRMDAGQHHVQAGGQTTTGVSPSRPVRHERQHSAKDIRVPLSRPSSSGHGRNGSRLEPMAFSVSVSAHNSGFETDSQTGSIRRDGDSHSPSHRGLSFVSGSRRQVSWSTQIATPRIPESDHSTGGRIPPRAGAVLASRVDTINNFFLNRGFSKRSLKIFNSSLAPSSQTSYQSAWVLFREYLSVNRISDDLVGEEHVYDFLTHHIVTHKRKYRTIAKYRAALVKPVKAAFGFDINNSDFNKDFMRGYYRMNPPVISAAMPVWSLNTLFTFLNSELFEPLENSDLTHLTMKTVCLLLLATGRRISEVANLGRTSHCRGGFPGFFLNWANPGFQSKNFEKINRKRAKDGDHQTNIPYIEPISHHDKSLCPVRVYHAFLDRTNGPRSSKFLWDHGADKANIPKLSRIFNECVKLSLQHSRVINEPSIGPHQCRKLAASYGLLLCESSHDEMRLMRTMGFSSLSVLRRVYMNRVPPLDHACVVPGGTYHPGVTRLKSYRLRNN